MTNPHRTAELERLLDEARGHIRALLDILTRGGNGDPFSVGRAKAFIAKPNPVEVPDTLTGRDAT